MKKYIFTLITIITIFLFNINLKAETCTYNFRPQDSGKITVLKFDITSDSGEYTIKYNNRQLPVWDANSTMVDNYYADGYYYFVGGQNALVASETSKVSGCPNLTISQEVKSLKKYNFDYFKYKTDSGEINARIICVNASGSTTCTSGQLFAPTNNGEEIFGDKANANAKTVYKVSKKAGKLFGLDPNNTYYNKDVTIIITSYLGDKYYVEINGEESTGGYLNTSTNNSNIIWQASSMANTAGRTLVIRQSELEGIKQAYPYVPGSKSKIAKTLNVCALNKNNQFAITTSSTCPEDSKSTTSVQMIDDDTYQTSKTSDLSATYKFNVDVKPFDIATGCKLLGDNEELKELLQNIFTIIKVASIILLIVFSMLDFSKVITQDKQVLMASVKKWATRLIILLIVLLLPTFIDIIGNLIGVEDVLCGIR